HGGGSTFDILNTDKLYPVLKFILIAPIMGLVLGYFFMVLVYWLFRKSRPQKVDRTFRVGQLLSSAAFSIGHGGNDAQKTMGIITVLLFSAREVPFIRDYLYWHDDFSVPTWVKLTSITVISLGTLSGGWKIIKTMGVKLTHLKPSGGFSAETAGAITLFGATHMGIPVSTTQTIAGAIMGVGTTKRLSAVKWGIAGNIVLTWILTIPFSALLSALVYFVMLLFMK